jgi:hypothetical protein
VGGIQSASQGGFQINSQSGSTSELDKLVRVVTNITFYLENKRQLPQNTAKIGTIK